MSPQNIPWSPFTINPSKPLDLLSVAVASPFLECHRNGVTQCAVLCVGRLPLSTVARSSVDVVAGGGTWSCSTAEQCPLQLCSHSPGLFLDSDGYKAAANFYRQALGGHVFISLGSGIVRIYGKHVFNLIRNSLCHVMYVFI